MEELRAAQLQTLSGVLAVITQLQAKALTSTLLTDIVAATANRDFSALGNLAALTCPNESVPSVLKSIENLLKPEPVASQDKPPEAQDSASKDEKKEKKEKKEQKKESKEQEKKKEGGLLTRISSIIFKGKEKETGSEMHLGTKSHWFDPKTGRYRFENDQGQAEEQIPLPPKKGQMKPQQKQQKSEPLNNVEALMAVDTRAKRKQGKKRSNPKSIVPQAFEPAQSEEERKVRQLISGLTEQAIRLLHPKIDLTQLVDQFGLLLQSAQSISQVLGRVEPQKIIPVVETQCAGGPNDLSLRLIESLQDRLCKRATVSQSHMIQLQQLNLQLKSQMQGSEQMESVRSQLRAGVLTMEQELLIAKEEGMRLITQMARLKILFDLESQKILQQESRIQQLQGENQDLLQRAKAAEWSHEEERQKAEVVRKRLSTVQLQLREQSKQLSRLEGELEQRTSEIELLKAETDQLLKKPAIDLALLEEVAPFVSGPLSQPLHQGVLLKGKELEAAAASACSQTVSRLHEWMASCIREQREEMTFLAESLTYYQQESIYQRQSRSWQVQRLSNEISYLKQEFSQSQVGNQHTKESLSKSLSALQAENSSLRLQLDRAPKVHELTSLQSSLTKFQQKINKLQKALNSADERARSAAEQLKVVRAEQQRERRARTQEEQRTAELEQAVDTMEEELKQLRWDNAELESKLATCSDQKQFFKLAAERQEKVRRKLEQASKANDQRLRAAREQGERKLALAQAEQESMASDLRLISQRYQALEAELQQAGQAKSHCERLQMEVDCEKDKSQQLQSKLNQLIQQLDQEKQRTWFLQQTVLKYEGEIARLKEQSQLSQADFEDKARVFTAQLQNKMNAAQQTESQLTSKRQELQSLKLQLQKLKVNNQNLQLQLLQQKRLNVHSREQLQSQKIKCSKLQNDLQDALSVGKKVEQLQSRLLTLGEESELLAAALEQSSEQLQDQRMRADMLEQQKAGQERQFQHQLASLREQHQADKKAIEEGRQQLQLNCSRLQSVLADLRAEVAGQSERVRKADQEKQAIFKQYQEIVLVVQQNGKQRSRLEEQIHSLATANARLLESQRQLQNLRQQLKSNLVQDKGDREQEAKSLKQQVKSWIVKFEQADKQLARVKQLKDKFVSQNEKMKVENEELAREIQRLKAEAQRQSEQFELSKETVQRVLSQNSELRDVALQSRGSQGKQCLSILCKDRIQQLEAKVEELQDLSRSLGVKIQELETQNRALAEEIIRKEEQQEKMLQQQIIQTGQVQSQAIRAQNNQLRQQLKQINQQLEVAVRKLGQKESAIRGLQDKIAAETKALQQLGQTNAKLQQECQELRTDKERLLRLTRRAGGDEAAKQDKQKGMMNTLVKLFLTQSEVRKSDEQTEPRN